MYRPPGGVGQQLEKNWESQWQGMGELYMEETLYQGDLPIIMKSKEQCFEIGISSVDTAHLGTLAFKLYLFNIF